ncbi:hypothetical protein EXN66_Car013589 [Channa argus]|uniref:Uncharacterized protein n=1 Tax=Channa argus TaxID=215402 RepID=A0A6G1Q6L9_CHAAH|nr:hypothetical protein EXN66_Car013589 [Channa argus]
MHIKLVLKDKVGFSLWLVRERVSVEHVCIQPCFLAGFPLKDILCFPLRLHALRGLKGDATECKSSFRITYINVY